MMRKVRLLATILLVVFISLGCTGDSSSNPDSVPQDNAPSNAIETLDPSTSNEIFAPENGENEEHTVNIDERLLGVWETERGVPLWFFCSPTTIEFFSDGSVHESCCDKYATIEFHGDGRFTLIGKSGHATTGGIVEGPFIFTYSFSDEQLTLIDEDGDQAVFNRKQS